MSVAELSGWGHLRVTAEMYEDHQKSRIAQENRVRSATVSEAFYVEYIADLKKMEERLGRKLSRALTAAAPVAVAEWAAATPGVGCGVLLGRLLGALGHPRLATPKVWADNSDDDGPKRFLVELYPFERSVSQLWQYCGHGAPVRRRAGMTQDEALALGNPQCKMLVHLLAESIVKAQVRKDPDDEGARVAIAPLGEFYLSEKAKYAERNGRSPLHIHNIALRHTGKEILRGLWLAAE